MSLHCNALSKDKGVISTKVGAVIDGGSVLLFDILKTEAQLRNLVSDTSFIPKAADEVCISFRDGLHGKELVVSLEIEAEDVDVEGASAELKAAGFNFCDES